MKRVWKVVLAASALLFTASDAMLAQENFVRVPAGIVALTNVDVIDGTGTPVKSGQTIVLEAGRITAVGPADTTPAPSGAQVLDLRGRTVMPGLVGMHDHLFYSEIGTGQFVHVGRTFARLYLASGVTTIRTGGTTDLEQDIALKREIDAGREPGPKIHLTSPYLGGAPDIPSLEAAIERFANGGVTTLKAYTGTTSAELAAIMRAARARGLTVTGHLCAVGFRDAAAMGIHNLEHGIVVDAGLYSRKVPDQCPPVADVVAELSRMNVASPAIQETIAQLVAQQVAVTSTLAVFETYTARTSFFDRRVQPLFVSTTWNDYLNHVQQRASAPQQYTAWTAAFGVEMAFERRFVEAGGWLMAGADPTGWGGVLAGFANHRTVELLVEAGFRPEQAIQIATANGAMFLGESERIGTIEVGKQADLFVVRGNPAAQITDIRNVELVFKDGVGYDAVQLLQSEHGNLGTRSWTWWVAVVTVPAIVLLVVVRRITTRRKKPVYGHAPQYRRR